MIRVLLADDQALVRGGFRLILEAEPDIEVVAEAADGDQAVELEIADTGTGTPAGRGTGHGLIGMRERVAMFGGDLEATRAAGGGFTVRARLPLPSPASA